MFETKNRKWGHYRKKKAPIEALEEENASKIAEPPKAVLFIQHTANSELASEARKVIQTLRPWTKINLKVVERGGQKLQDILSKSNPWGNVDCGRIDCFTCSSSSKCEKSTFKSCFQRSVVYQTWCHMCTVTHRTDKSDEDHG